MKGLERITNIRLAEVLTQNELVTREEMADAIASQESSGESFANVLVSTGYLTEWDLAKSVAEYFQLPFIQSGRYTNNIEVIEIFDEEFLFEHMFVPLDRFGDLVTIAMPILLPGEIMINIQEKEQIEVFPVVSLFSENKKKLMDLYPDHQIKEKKVVATQKKEEIQGGEWENIFDIGDEAVKKEINPST